MKGKIHTFKIDYKSEDTGDTFSGQFTCKKQSILDKSKISKRKAELCGGMYCVLDDNSNPTGQGIDANVEALNMVIATLEVTLVQTPEWWDLDVLNDEDLIVTVWSEVQKFEDSFRRRRRTQDSSNLDDGSSKKSSKEEHQVSDVSNQPKKVVDPEVQAALDA